LTLSADAHAIYLLNLLLAFLQPRFDPSLEADLMDDEIEGGGVEDTPLPSSLDDEFRPFVRRLPEWNFWWVATYGSSAYTHLDLPSKALGYARDCICHPFDTF
jgi:hypothetical protein